MNGAGIAGIAFGVMVLIAVLVGGIAAAGTICGCMKVDKDED